MQTLFESNNFNLILFQYSLHLEYENKIMR